MFITCIWAGALPLLKCASIQAVQKMNTLREKKGDVSSRFLRPLAVALSVAAFSGALLTPRGLKGEEPRPAVVTLAQGGPAAIGVPQPKEEVNVFEDGFVKFKTVGMVGSIITIEDKTNGGKIEVRDKHDKSVDTVKVGKHVAFITSEAGEVEIWVNGQARGSIWVRSKGSLAPTDEESETLPECEAFLSLIKRGLSTKDAITETMAAITLATSMRELDSRGEASRAQEIAGIYDNDGDAEKLLSKMDEWGYGGFARGRRQINAIFKLVAEKIMCN